MCRCGNMILEKPRKFDFVGFFVDTECNSALSEFKFNYCNLIYLLNFKKSKIMKNQNYLTTGLAIVGAISLIIMACSAEGSQESNSTNNVNSIGKYQITTVNIGSSLSSNVFHILDTETGVVKTYIYNGTIYDLHRTTITQ